MELLKIRALALQEDRARDSEWDKRFHIQVAKGDPELRAGDLTEQLWLHREPVTPTGANSEHIDDKAISSWCDDHDQNPQGPDAGSAGAKLAMWQHLENTKQMLFQATIFDDRNGG